MIKKLLPFFFLAASTLTAQHTIKGIMSPKLKSDWIIIYKLEGTKKQFVNNTTIKSDSIFIGGNKEEIGAFEFQLPSDAKPGAYRVTYRLKEEGFVDFYYNNEDVAFVFNPSYPQESIAFSESSENMLYRNYLEAISIAQQKLDSIQVAVLKEPTLDLAETYKKAYQELNYVQNSYEQKSKGKYVASVIKATLRVNSPVILNSVNAYLQQIKNSFFDRLDFEDPRLINSSFLTNRILDYIFYVNYSKDLKKQQSLYKLSITKVLSKIKNIPYKKEIITFLIAQFETIKNIEIIDFLFEEHYNKLPIDIQDKKFKEDKQQLFAAEIGRIAPNFSWEEDGKHMEISSLNDAPNYILVFWSTSCSHCLREIPELYSYSKTKSNLKVVAFALENDAFIWETYSKANLKGWHNVLGLNKWENKIARTYQINATPSYFILDKNKKIIAKPDTIDEVKTFVEKL